MQWEYRTILYKKATLLTGTIDIAELETILNEVGRERWELVSAAPNMHLGTQRGFVLIFKRQR
ncbi:MAG: DUF4177 domain-containing protein [Pseudomonadota bacterium]